MWFVSMRGIVVGVLLCAVFTGLLGLRLRTEHDE